jgi:DNA-binding NtrC family response regulator
MIDAHNVLVVEDDLAVLDAFRMVFRHAGLTPLTAATPEEALVLWRARAGEISAAVVDFDLKTTMNGHQLCETMRREDPGLLTILLSGHSFVSSQLGRIEGVNFFSKPFSIRALTSALKETLTQSGEMGSLEVAETA